MKRFAVLLLLAGCTSAPHPAVPVPLAGVRLSSEPLVSPAALLALVPGLVTQVDSPTSDRKVDGDPLNLTLVGTKDQLNAAMAKAGWVVPDPITIQSTLKLGVALVKGTPYPTAPVSDLYLFGRKQDLAWEANSSNVHRRDHCRAWLSSLTTPDGQPIWLMAGTQDVGVGWDSRRHMPTHRIGADVDAERDFIVQTLHETGLVARQDQLPGIGGGQPFSGKNGGGDVYHTDGMMALLAF